MVCQYVSGRLGISLSRSTCLNYLHRMEFAFKRLRKRLVKADDAKRESFPAECAALWDGARRPGARVFFADGAHFRMDAELRGRWALRGLPGSVFTGTGLVGLQQPRCREKADCYSAVYLDTGEVEWDEPDRNSNSRTSSFFLGQLREERWSAERDWDNAPAHRGQALRESLRTPGLNLRLYNPPRYSRDCNADEAIWGLMRE